MRSCCVAGCKNTSCCEMLHFFTFPKTKERTEWIKFAEREDWTPSKYSTICSDHFCSQRKNEKKHLRKGAVPTFRQGETHCSQNVEQGMNSFFPFNLLTRFNY